MPEVFLGRFLVSVISLLWPFSRGFQFATRGDGLRPPKYPPRMRKILWYPGYSQSQVKPKPIVTRLRTFSRASRRLLLFALRFDWFTGLSMSFVIGQSDLFGLSYDAQLKTALFYVYLFQFNCTLKHTITKVHCSSIYTCKCFWSFICHDKPYLNLNSKWKFSLLIAIHFFQWKLWEFGIISRQHPLVGDFLYSHLLLIL